MANIITREDHTYKHYNRAFGCKVESKEHYDYLMKKTGMRPYEECQRIAEKAKSKLHKDYKLSGEAREFITSIKQTADRKGNIRLGDRAIDQMKKLGVNFNANIPDK